MRLDNDDGRADAGDRLPDPVVVPVDVDREHVDIATEPLFFQDPIDVTGAHDGLTEPRRAVAGVGMPSVDRPTPLDERRVRLEKQTVEAEIESEVCAVAGVTAVARADVDEPPLGAAGRGEKE